MSALSIKRGSAVLPCSGARRRPGVAVAVTSVQSPHSNHSLQAEQPPNNHTLDEDICSHPDAVRRRLEQQEWQRRREAQLVKDRLDSSNGVKWFDQPSTMVACKGPEDYKRLVEQAAQEGRLLVAKMFTEDCYVCKTLHPKMKKIAEDNPDVIWAKLNGSDPTMVGLFTSLGVTKVPLFHMVLDGQLVAELTASLSPEKLAAFRAELAAHKPPPRAA